MSSPNQRAQRTRPDGEPFDESGPRARRAGYGRDGGAGQAGGGDTSGHTAADEREPRRFGEPAAELDLALAGLMPCILQHVE